MTEPTLAGELAAPVAWMKPNWEDNYDGMSPVSTYYTKGWTALYTATALAANDEAARATFDHAKAAAYGIGEVARLREALERIADIGEGSTTANSLQNIAKLARAALNASVDGGGK